MAQLPALAITSTSVVSSQAAMLALSAQVGDVTVRTDLSKSFILGAEPASMLGNWVELLSLTPFVTSVAGRTGAVSLVANDVGDATAAGKALLTAASVAAQRTLLGLDAPTFTSVTIAQGTLTSATAGLDHSATWNNAAVTFIGWRLNVTNTASAAGARLLDLQVSGATQLCVDKLGNLQLGSDVVGTAAAKTLALTNAATPPTTSADRVHLYAQDLPVSGNASLAVYAEAPVIAAVGLLSTHKIPVRYNGVVYFLLANNTLVGL